MSGLPLVFSFFMMKDKSSSKKKKKKEFIYKPDQEETEEDEHNSLSLISNILRTTTSVVFDRVFYKFKENTFEKVDRLIDLHKYYATKLRSTESDENDGFMTLQLVDFIITFLHNLDDFDLNDHIQKMMGIHSIDKNDVHKVSQTYTKTFGIEEEPDSPKRVKEFEFKSVSQNPSESESEEVVKGSKRIKLGEAVLNTDNMQPPGSETD